MTTSLIAEIKRKVSLLEIVEQDVQLKREGKNFRGHCPHPNHPDSTPSFVVGRNKRGELVASCFGCGKVNMDVINYLQWVHGLTFGEALERLAAYAGIQQPQVALHDLFEDIMALARDQLYESPKALEYLTDFRRLSPQVIQDAGIGFVADGYELVKTLLKKGYTWRQLAHIGFVTPDTYRCRFVNRILIPLWRYGEIRALAGRQIQDDGKFVRYLYTSTEVPGVYYLPMSPGHRSLVLVEGLMDLLSARTMGMKAVAALTSAVYAGHEDVDALLEKFDRVCYLGHTDTAGQKALATLQERHSHKIVPLSLPAGYKDLNEVLQDGKDGDWLREWFRGACSRALKSA